MASLSGGPLWSGDTAKHRERVHRIAHADPADLPRHDHTAERIALHAAEADAKAAREGTEADRKRRERERLEDLRASKEAERLAAEPIPAYVPQTPDQLTLGG